MKLFSLLVLVGFVSSAHSKSLQITAFTPSFNLTGCTLIKDYQDAIENNNPEQAKLLEHMIGNSLGYEAVVATLRLETPATLQIKNLSIKDSQNNELVLAKVWSGVGTMNGDQIVFSIPGAVSIQLTLTLAGFCKYLNDQESNESNIRNALEGAIPNYLTVQ